MGPPVVSVGTEPQRGEGWRPEKQGMGWGMWGQPRWGGDMEVLCPRLQIRETTEEPTPMQTHDG